MAELSLGDYLRRWKSIENTSPQENGIYVPISNIVIYKTGAHDFNHKNLHNHATWLTSKLESDDGYSFIGKDGMCNSGPLIRRTTESIEVVGREDAYIQILPQHSVNGSTAWNVLMPKNSSSSSYIITEYPFSRRILDDTVLNIFHVVSGANHGFSARRFYAWEHADNPFAKK